MNSRSNLRIHGVKKVHHRPLSTKIVLGFKFLSHKSQSAAGGESPHLPQLFALPLGPGQGMGWANLQSSIETLVSGLWSLNFKKISDHRWRAMRYLTSPGFALCCDTRGRR